MLKSNDYMKQYGFLGIGAAGSNITKLFEADGYTCIIANSSIEDLTQIKDAKNKLHFPGGIGCHKNRAKSKELLKNNVDLLINEIKAKMPEVKTLFLSASAAGGTGSGMLAWAAAVIKNALDINISIVTILPSKAELFQANANTIELFKELEKLENLGATFILDNDKSENKMFINKMFHTHLTALLANENGSEQGCVDRGEINELLQTKGMAILCKIGNEKTNTELLLNAIVKSNAYASIEGDNVLRHFCLMNSTDNINKKVIFENIGMPVDEYIGHGTNSTVCMVTGLSFPKTRLNEIRKTTQANGDIIRKNMETAKKSIFDDEDVGFIDMFSEKPVKKESKKKSNYDLLSELAL